MVRNNSEFYYEFLSKERRKSNKWNGSKGRDLTERRVDKKIIIGTKSIVTLIIAELEIFEIAAAREAPSRSDGGENVRRAENIQHLLRFFGKLRRRLVKILRVFSLKINSQPPKPFEIFWSDCSYSRALNSKLKSTRTTITKSPLTRRQRRYEGQLKQHRDWVGCFLGVFFPLLLLLVLQRFSYSFLVAFWHSRRVKASFFRRCLARREKKWSYSFRPGESWRASQKIHLKQILLKTDQRI